MNQILSLDLGTASIGWAVREKTLPASIESIVASGVVIFPEGYGTQKGNQFSLASARRVKRGHKKRGPLSPLKMFSQRLKTLL